MATLITRVTDLAVAVATALKATRTLLNGNQADLSALTTTAKSNLVAALNEVAAAVGEAGATIDDGAVSTLSVWSSDKTDEEIDERVAAAITALVGTAAANLDTLGEISDALNDDANIASTLTTLIGTKANANNAALTGVPTAPTAAAGTSTTQVATTAFVAAATPAASETVAGLVERLTNAETVTGTDTTRYMSVANLRHVMGDPDTDLAAAFAAALA